MHPTIQSFTQDSINALSYSANIYDTSYVNVISTTPLPLLNAIKAVHQANNNKPSKSYLSQHADSIATLHSTSFTKFCWTTFHVDGGANVNGVIDKSMFYFFIEDVSGIEQVGGDKIVCSGWGGIIIDCGGYNQLLAPVYYCPGNPRNTLSLSTFTNFCGCNSTIVNTNNHLDIVRNNRDTIRFEFYVHNDLDHINLVIQRFANSPVMASSNVTNLRRSPHLSIQNNQQSKKETSLSVKPSSTKQINDVPPPVQTNEINNADNIDIQPIQQTLQYPSTFDIYHNGQYVTSFDRSVMATIALYCILLQSGTSPRKEEIQKMNSIMGNYYNSLEQTSDTKKNVQIADNNDVDSLIYPVAAKLCQTSKWEPSAFYDWSYMHLSLLHSLPSTLDIMICKQLLRDIPESLQKKHRFDCYCHVCALRKAKKLPRGKQADKFNLAPFERIHMDFEFIGTD